MTSTGQLIASATSADELLIGLPTSVICDFTSAMIGSTSSSRCFWTKALGFRSRKSRFSNSGPELLAQLLLGVAGHVRR